MVGGSQWEKVKRGQQSNFFPPALSLISQTQNLACCHTYYCQHCFNKIRSIKYFEIFDEKV